MFLIAAAAAYLKRYVHMRTLFALCVLSAFPVAAAADPVEIWSYAFVTTNAQEPIGGEGSAIFKSNDSGLEGPIWSVDHRFGFRLKFALKENTVVAVLTPEKEPKHEIELHGMATQTAEPDGKGCSVQVSLTNGVHHLLLQRFINKCAT
jgi:hypothetical protein